MVPGYYFNFSCVDIGRRQVSIWHGTPLERALITDMPTIMPDSKIHLERRVEDGMRTYFGSKYQSGNEKSISMSLSYDEHPECKLNETPDLRKLFVSVRQYQQILDRFIEENLAWYFQARSDLGLTDADEDALENNKMGEFYESIYARMREIKPELLAFPYNRFEGMDSFFESLPTLVPFGRHPESL